MKSCPTSALKQKLAMLAGKQFSHRDDGVDELNALLLQIVLAVMLIFMIAFFLFMNKVGGEISRIDQMRQKLSEAEEAEWLRALDKVTEIHRIAYGLTEFLHIDPESGVKWYDFSEMISDGKLVASAPRRRAFCLGAAAAHRDYSLGFAELEHRWLRMLEKLQKKSVGGAQLKNMVRERILSLRREVVEVQALAAAEIQRNFAAHPEKLHDKEINRLLTRIEGEKDFTARTLLMRELAVRVRRSAYAYLSQLSGVPMLEAER